MKEESHRSCGHTRRVCLLRLQHANYDPGPTKVSPRIGIARQRQVRDVCLPSVTRVRRFLPLTVNSNFNYTNTVSRQTQYRKHNNKLSKIIYYFI